VEAVAVTLTLGDGVVPATLGTEEVDSRFEELQVATRRLECKPGPVLALAEGFGGRCVALLFAPPASTGRG
jgi:3-oxoacyl-(acyl-carrier-protein) synthase